MTKQERPDIDFTYKNQKIVLVLASISSWLKPSTIPLINERFYTPRRLHHLVWIIPPVRHHEEYGIQVSSPIKQSIFVQLVTAIIQVNNCVNKWENESASYGVSSDPHL